jgi:hypothetical protein
MLNEKSERGMRISQVAAWSSGEEKLILFTDCPPNKPGCHKPLTESASGRGYKESVDILKGMDSIQFQVSAFEDDRIRYKSLSSCFRFPRSPLLWPVKRPDRKQKEDTIRSLHSYYTVSLVQSGFEFLAVAYTAPIQNLVDPQNEQCGTCALERCNSCTTVHVQSKPCLPLKNSPYGAGPKQYRVSKFMKPSFSQRHVSKRSLSIQK